MLFVSKQTLQTWNYRRVPHDLIRNSLPRTTLPHNIPRVLSPNLIPQCTAYGTCIQILVLITTVEDTIIRICMYLLYLQSKRANKLFCFIYCGRQLVILRKHIF
jgi:hypothetical protein